MDWDGLSLFLQEIRLFLKQSTNKTNEVEGMIEKCEFYISATLNLKFADEVDLPAESTTYLNMDNKGATEYSNEETIELSEYIDMDECRVRPIAQKEVIECPYIGLPEAHLKLNKDVRIIQENMKIVEKKLTVKCALLKGPWLLYYPANAKNALKPQKYFFVVNFEVPSSADQLIMQCSDGLEQTLNFETGTIRELWIKAIREELLTYDGVYDDPNNLRMDEKIYRTLHYDIPKMPPKPVNPKSSSPNRAEFQLKYQEIKEQLASQLQPKRSSPSTDRPQRSNGSSPQKKFGRFMNIFRSSSASTGQSSSSHPVEMSVKKPFGIQDKTAKIMGYRRNTTIISSDYEIVGS